MALALPGQTAVAMPALQGAAKLEQGLLSKLIECGVPDTVINELATKDVCVHEVAVVGNAQRTIDRLDDVRLSISQAGAAGGAVSGVADCELPLQRGEVVLVKDGVNKILPLVDMRNAVVDRRHAGRASRGHRPRRQRRDERLAGSFLVPDSSGHRERRAHRVAQEQPSGAVDRARAVAMMERDDDRCLVMLDAMTRERRRRRRLT